MSRFPDADHLASWAGVSPGNNESAGKRRSGKTCKGNKALCVVYSFHPVGGITDKLTRGAHPSTAKPNAAFKPRSGG